MTARPLSEAVPAAAAAPRYPFPWAWPGGRPLPLIGYGSLMNAASAARTLRSGVGTPVVAFGVQRVFDYRMPASTRARYPHVPDPQLAAVLNVRPTGRLTDRVNGVLVSVVPDDLPALRLREADYDLVPVAYAAFTGGEVAPEVAFVCACPPTCPRLDARLLPHPGYLALCLEGAKEVGDEFARDFLRTTYLADGATDLETWLAKTGGS